MGELALYDPGDSFGPPGSLDGLRSAKTITRAAARGERPGPQFPHRSLVSFMSRLMSLGSEPLRDQLAGPAHPPGGRVRVVAELLCHPADAAADAELLHGAADCHGHYVSGRDV